LAAAAAAVAETAAATVSGSHSYRRSLAVKRDSDTNNALGDEMGSDFCADP